jgi:uncharacterized coiled-coil protein SlyX
MGFSYPNANGSGGEDQFLGRIDFPGDTCLVLSGNGKWIDICDLGGGGDLDWEVDGNDLYTGHGNGYPDDRVGIGTEFPDSKLHVRGTITTTPGEIRTLTVEADGTNAVANFLSVGAQINAEGAQGNYAIRTQMLDGSTDVNIGYKLDVFREASNFNIGSDIRVRGANDGAVASENIGVSADVTNPAFIYDAYANYGFKAEVCDARLNFGIYSEVCDDPNTQNWAGFFNGDVEVINGMYIGSDENIKENIEDVDDATGILSSLNPKTFSYQDLEQLSTTGGNHFGLIAQEVEEELPELVKETTIPQQTDSAGNIVREELTYKSVRYNDLIGILIAGFNEQHAEAAAQESIVEDQNETIEALQSQLQEQAAQMANMQEDMAAVLESVAQMQQKTNNCCQDKGSATGQNVAPVINDGKELKLGQNVPNPFMAQTRINYTLPNDARVTLEITDASGRPVATLVNGQMGAGEHSITWDGTNVAPGVYFYTVYADGELLTKKMIKK